MKKTNLLVGFVLLLQIATAQIQPNIYRDANQAEMNAWVDSVYSSLTLDERIGQLFMVIANTDNTDANKNLIKRYIDQQKIGGILFSKGNITTQATLTNYAQKESKTPLFISLDGEWGLNMRLTDAPQFPRNMILGSIKNDSLLYLYGKEVARQCKELGIHINFAPVLDVNSNPNNPVIGNRAFGENPENVAIKGIAYARGLEDGGVMAVAKHFPGHGDTSEDSHKTLPTIAHSRERLDSVELFPFQSYINAGLSGMMVAHLNIPILNTRGLPSTLTPEIGRELLKEEMEFSGLTFTDGMAMKGVTNQSSMSVKAILAGNDVVLGAPNVSSEFQSVKEAVENNTISAEMLEKKVRKILAYKFITGTHIFTPIDGNEATRSINNSYAEWLIRKLHNSSMVLMKNDVELLPIKNLDKHKIASVAIGVSNTAPFQTWLNKYADIVTFQVSQSSEVADLKSKLEEYDVVIYSIHTRHTRDAAALQQQLKNKKSITVFFTSPYQLSGFTQSIANSQSVVLAHTNNKEAQISAAQALFGGIAVDGIMPVTIGEYKANEGLTTPKTRLAYQLPEEVGINSQQFNSIERIALEGIRQKAYPGCQILIAKDGVVIYDRQFGRFEYDSNSSEVTDQTVYDLASITKATATLPAIMKLYDTKQIRLQDTFSKFIPETKNSNKANITIRKALLHESGILPYIPYYTFAIDKNSYTGALLVNRRSNTHNAKFAGMWGRTNYKFRNNLISGVNTPTFNLPVSDKMFASEEMQKTLITEIINTNLRKTNRYAYSCLNFMLLKEAVENISKQDLNEFTQKNFYKKLGATTTTFQPLKYMSNEQIPPTEDDQFFRKQMLRGYVHDEGAALFGGISGNAGLFSSANDLAKIYQMYLNGGSYGGEQLISEETMRLFTTTKSSVSRRGLGFDKPDLRNNNLSPTCPQAPISVYGHTGYTGTSFWIDPDSQMIFIFLSNRVHPSRSPNRLHTLETRKRIQDEIYNALKQEKKVQTDATDN
ncbi:MAG TPA: glycoside hydrolase family 3 N-terminal domain-containing protein [Dysgonamonadaceae bacterium]|nr:glycoside hydrolase family 3 N-terminal domain-containing protein [Dysgonamonadaceae bacterium]